jgi:molybdenum cofactor biosynthesis protein B
LKAKIFGLFEDHYQEFIVSTEEHRKQAAGRIARCAVLTISDTRTAETDTGGKLIREALTEAGHQVVDCVIVKDEPDQIKHQLDAWLAQPGQVAGAEAGAGAGAFDLIVTTGGTGISSRDTTIEVVERLLDKKLEGFGELFRMLSWDEVGPAAMLSRAVAGLAGDSLIFALPGSTNAVGLAMSKLILPELAHLIWERAR